MAEELPSRVALMRVDLGDVFSDIYPGPPQIFNQTDTAPPNLGVRPIRKEPYSLERWLPFILDSRGQDLARVQRVDLTPREARAILNARARGFSPGYIRADMVHELQTIVCPLFRDLRFHPGGLYMKLNDMAKVPVHAHHDNKRTRHHVTAVFEIILRLVASPRSMDFIKRSLRAEAESIPITFIPFDNRIDQDREYRVFCAPGSGKITAISQYAWYKQWEFANLPEYSAADLLDEIFRGIEDLHEDIIAQLEPETNRMDRTFLKQGFTFDAFFDETTGDMGVVEINEFGARSDCSPCLFHWEEDFNLLYGQRDRAQFRVVL